MAISSINDILKAGAAEEVTLPGWGNGDTFSCRLRKPSMYAMMASGSVPNPIIPFIERLFMGSPITGETNQAENAKAIIMLTDAALKEPTSGELAENGIELTDDQRLAIYAYVLGGALGVARFHSLTRGGDTEHGAGNGSAAQRADGD